ncbi:unnamed protein product [Moneuplotes crassus]|uniref:Uncharacterized protein n=1 Tax=Euplotes crassus TaxID=5936 RepID=A0AAD1XPD6_EUPCR|nr:unnamed protein product [Moneuplotes crassus]
MEATPPCPDPTQKISKETEIALKEEAINQDVLEVISDFKRSSPLSVFKKNADTYTINMLNEEDVIKDLAKVVLPRDLKIHACIKASGSKTKLHHQMAMNIRRSSLDKLIIGLNKLFGNKINYPIFKPLLRSFPASKIDCHVSAMRVTECMLVKILKSCWRIHQLIFNACVIEEIKEFEGFPKNSALEILKFRKCNSAKGLRLDHCSSLESLIKFISLTSLKESLKVLYLYDVDDKSRLAALKDTYRLSGTTFTYFNIETMADVTFA